MSELMERLKNVKKMVDLGDGMEKLRAQQMLDVLMAKNGLTIEDIDQNTEKNHWVTLKEADFRIWVQIWRCYDPNIKLYNILADHDVRTNGFAGNTYVFCTPSQFNEVYPKFEHYAAFYQQEQDVFYQAFLLKNDLIQFDNSIQQGSLTYEQRVAVFRIQGMAEMIQKSTYHKKLPHGQ